MREINSLARQYSLKLGTVYQAIQKSGVYVRTSFGKDYVNDADIDRILDEYHKILMQTGEEAPLEDQLEKEKELAGILISSGFNFEGYRIVKYSGYISGDDAISISRGTDSIFSGATNVEEMLMKSLTKIRQRALLELKEAAYALGCNAVIGVDFDYITLDPETANFVGGTTYLPYVFGVTANGNAVIIEKIDE